MTLIDIINGVSTVGGPALLIVLSVIAKHLLTVAKSLESGQNELKQDNVALLRSRIKERADMFLDRGYITKEEAEDIDHLNDRYKREGGNSFVAELMVRVHKLPLKD